MACPRCKQTHQTAEEVKACLAEWQRTRGVTPIKDLIARSSLGTPAIALRKRADPKVVERALARADEAQRLPSSMRMAAVYTKGAVDIQKDLQGVVAKKVTDKGTRRGGLGELEVAPGDDALTKKPGYFAFARALIGNFPVCWRSTEEEAREYGEQFMRDVADGKR